MAALKLLTFVTLVYAAHAGDRDLAFKLSACLKKAITAGIPAVHIPPHDPLIINHNLSWHGDIGIASATLNLTNLVWYGIPHWNLQLRQFSNDSAAHAIFEYELRWPEFVFTSQYTLDASVALIPEHLQGDLNITLSGTSWKGSLNFTKPGFRLTEGLEELLLDWKADGVHFDFNGLGILNHVVSSALSGLVKVFLDSGAMGNTLGEALKTRLNTVWFQHNERIDVILEYCRKN